MEVGAVKQAYNNEVIHLKNKLNQTKIQVIHKLTRKAKTLKEKKSPEHVKEKLNRKAESAVAEVLLLKKIKPKHVAGFAVRHKGELKDFLNKPTVDVDKACARLLLHKNLQDKYRLLRDRFSGVPIKDLFMSRQERLKLKKEVREQKKDKKAKSKNKENHNTSTGDWTIEDIEDVNDNKLRISKGDSSDEDDKVDRHSVSDSEGQDVGDNESFNSDANTTDTNSEQEKEEVSMKPTVQATGKTINIIKPVKKYKNVTEIHELIKDEKNVNIKRNNELEEPTKVINATLSKQSKNQIKATISKSVNEKRQFRKSKEHSSLDIKPVQENRVVDPFFLTSTGENYMSLAEPRQADVIKEIHKQGNRKSRRAAMFGNVPKFRTQNDNNNGLIKRNGYKKDVNVTSNRQFNDSNQDNQNNPSVNKRKLQDKRDDKNNVPEKLHPSWEAKKRMSGIQPFQGKKIVFE